MNILKTCLYKIKHKTLMEDYKFFNLFLMNDKLVTAVCVLEVIIATKPPELGLTNAKLGQMCLQ